MNRVEIGNPVAYSFDDSTIRSLNSSVNVDIVGAELSIDQFTADVDYEVGAYVLFSPSDCDGVLTEDGYLFGTNEALPDIRQLPHGTVIKQYHDDVLVGKFYSRNVDRKSSITYRINGVSAIGLLDTKQHYGGLYNGTQTFSQVAASIIGATIPYSIEDDIKGVPIFGWLPIDSARNNLHKLMFAEGVSLTKDANGDIVFSYLYDAISSTVPSNRIYLGGNVDYSTPATAAEITEHSYYATNQEEVVSLFDNTDGSGAVTNLLVAFPDAPIHTLEANGLPVTGAGTYGTLTVHEYGVNYAIVSGTGTLDGQKYTHNTRVIRKDAVSPSGSENIVYVKDCGLISLANSENVAKRVLAYYESKKTVGAAIVLDGEKAGRQIEFTDPYGDTSTGFLSKMEIVASGKMKANCQIITDYTPTGQGNNYNTAEVLTGSGTFTVPDGITEIKVTLGGGGSGGSPGFAGANGTTYSGGAGGAGGAGGSGGKFYTAKITVTPGDTFSYACGSGGASGSAGGDTTFGTYSSASGSPSVSGFLNLFSGVIYGLSGESGVSGGAGASSGNPFPYVEYKGVRYMCGLLADTVYGYQGLCYGGYGGGGAVGATGGNGYTGGASWHGNIYLGDYGGNGGAGATPSITGDDATVYCAGGGGGHGGGGGGMPGGVDATTYGYSGTPGAFGLGGAGGRGGDGCIIIYY